MAHGFGLDGFPLGGDAEDVGGQGLDLVLVAGLHQLDQIADVLLVDGLPPGGEGEQALDHLGGLVPGLVLLPADFQLVVPAHHPDGQFLLNDANVLVEGAKDVNGILHYNPCLIH